MTDRDLKQVTIRYLCEMLADHFNTGELRDLCLRLNINLDRDIAGDTLRDKARELVEYCQRRSWLPELVHHFAEMRSGVSLPAEVTEYISTIKRLNRIEWLRAHGFEPDPFDPEAFKAETDPLFKIPGIPVFVEPPQMERLIGTPNSHGYRFIFAPAGGGKTSLRRRIFNQFTEDLRQWYPVKGKPLVLPVEYTLHDYSLKEATADAHIRRIARLMTHSGQRLLVAQSDTPVDFHIDVEQSLDDLIQTIATAIKRWQLDGICILIDNLGRQSHSPEESWSFILPLAARITDLLTIDGLMFKFFCPSEFLPSACSIHSSGYMYEIEWSKEQLHEILEKRITSCTNQQLPLIPGMAGNAFADLFGLPGRIERVKRQFVAFGLAQGAPAQMWQLGHYLLEGHFQKAGDRRQPVGALIRYETIDEALARLTQTEMSVTLTTTGTSHGSDFEAGVEMDPGRQDTLPTTGAKIPTTLGEVADILKEFCQNQKGDYNELLSALAIGNELSGRTNNKLIETLEKLVSTMDGLTKLIRELRSISGTEIDEQIDSTSSPVQVHFDKTTGLRNTKQQEELVQNIKNNVKRFIEEDNLLEAVESIKQLDENQGHLFSGDFIALSKEEIVGIKREEMRAELNRLRGRMLEWVDQFPGRQST